MYAKAVLLLIGGMGASVIILLESPSLKIAAMLLIAVWCFARAYYFAFYVIEHYIDPTYRFSGLGSFVTHLTRRDRSQ